ncbi:MAG: hypothetical protein O7F14_00870 [Alphaproteobacteria bacterium]|nr:hypothetical protein [Alphaproteobacteria bacterium]
MHASHDARCGVSGEGRNAPEGTSWECTLRMMSPTAGRTTRAGAKGVALSFCAASEYALLRDIEALIRIPITVDGGERPSGVVRAEPAPRGLNHVAREPAAIIFTVG